MSFATAFIFCTIGGFLIHFRPDKGGGTWDFILLIAGVISLGILIVQLGMVLAPGLFRRTP